MNDFDVYSDDMREVRRPTEGQQEAILTGLPVDEPDLVGLARFVEQVRSFGGQPLDEPLAAAHVALAADTAQDVRVASPVGRPTSATGRGIMRSTLKRKLALAVAAAAALAVGTAGLAIATDSSSPGDALYGMDRALENVGIGSGGAPERLEEVQALLDDNQVAGALDHAGDALSDLPQAAEIRSATDALHEAAARLADVETTAAAGANPATSTFRLQAADLLTSLGDQLADGGKVDGQSVASTAREFGSLARAFADTMVAASSPSLPEQAQVPDGVTPGPPPDAGPNSTDLPDTARAPGGVPGPPSGAP